MIDPFIVSASAGIFWLAIAEVAYSYVVYPRLLAVLARWFGRPSRASPLHEPAVAILVPIYNEEKVISEKLRNFLSLDYPSDKLSLWIGSDCSTDRTEEIVRRATDPRIHLWVTPGRCGKAGVLNGLVPQVDAEILIFTDADIMFDPGGVRALTRHFADPQIGGVGGMTLQQGEAAALTEEKIYRRFEAEQKKLESLLNSTISAFGPFYAIRKSLFVKFHPHTYSNDDVLMPMNIIRQGYRMCFEPAAVSYEAASRSIGLEFGRRIRIGAGNFQAFFWLLDFLNPAYGWPWFCYVSHKVSRWFSPMFMCAAALTCALLAFGTASLYYKLLFIAGAFFVVSGLCYRIIPLNFTRTAFYFMAMNAALLLGFFRFLGGIRSAVWPRTERQD